MYYSLTYYRDSEIVDTKNLCLCLFLPFILNFSITSLFSILNKSNVLSTFHKEVSIDIDKTLSLESKLHCRRNNNFPSVKDVIQKLTTLIFQVGHDLNLCI